MHTLTIRIFTGLFITMLLAGCSLPCFWSLVPGKIGRESFTSFFGAFHEIGGPRISMPRQDETIRIWAITNSDEDPHAAL